jgi:hypothetical protein
MVLVTIGRAAMSFPPDLFAAPDEMKRARKRGFDAL